MPFATFNGVTLEVVIPSTGDPVITMDAQEDFYEPWKDFLRQGAAAGNMNNKRFPQAFRPVAGDPLVPGVLNYAGLFFLQNQKGWRFLLPDEDVTLVITGLLALEDITLPFFRARAGRTGAILGLAEFVTNLDATVTTKIAETHTRLGLERGNALTDTPAGIDSASGDIDIDRTGDGVTSSTLTRQ